MPLKPSINYFLVIAWLLVTVFLTFYYVEPLIDWHTEAQIICYRFLFLTLVIAIFLRKEFVKILTSPQILLPALLLVALNQTAILIGLGASTPADAFILVQNDLSFVSKLYFLKETIYFNILSFTTQSIWIVWLYQSLLKVKFSEKHPTIEKETNLKPLSFFVRFLRMAGGLLFGWLAGLLIILPLIPAFIF